MFQIELTNLEEKEDYEILKSYCNRPSLKSDIIDKDIDFKERKAKIEINNSSRGIFLLYLIYNEFKPWILIKGIKKLFKSDFPNEIFQENFWSKDWNQSLENKIEELVYKK